MHGNFYVANEKSGMRGRPGKAYYLNEPQALVICALSRTAKAAQVRKALIDVFMAVRRGDVVTVRNIRAASRRAMSRRWHSVATWKPCAPSRIAQAH